jgi:hypothetical protein
MAYSRDKTVRLDWSYNGSRQVPVVSAHTTRGVQSVIESTQGQAVPRFSSKILSGQDATSAYSRSSMLKVEGIDPFNYVVVTGSTSVPSLIRRDYASGTWFPSLPAVGSQDVSDASQLALTRLYARLSEQQTHFRGMQFLGELRQTISMLRRPYQGIRQLIDTYINRVSHYRGRYQWRRSPNTRRELERAIASTWLETSFGLLPLISDVREASEAALALATNDNRKRDRVVGSAQTFVAGQSTEIISAVNATTYARVRSQGRGNIEHRVRYVAFLDWERTAAVGSLERVLEESGFRPDLFIPTIYELIPWSWLADYVSNLGTVIETGCQSQSAVKFCVKSASVINKIETQTSVLGNQGDPTSYANGTTGRHNIIRSSFVRSNSTAQIPNVPFQLAFPGRPTQWVNVLAVWRSNVRNIRF